MPQYFGQNRNKTLYDCLPPIYFDLPLPLMRSRKTAGKAKAKQLFFFFFQVYSSERLTFTRPGSISSLATYTLEILRGHEITFLITSGL